MFESGDSVRNRFWTCDCSVRFIERVRDLALCEWENVYDDHYIHGAPPRKCGDSVVLGYESLALVDPLRQFVIETRRQAGKE
jgi:hypothetical protein